MATFHFTQQQPDEQLFTDIGKLNAFPDDEVVSSLIDLLLNFLVSSGSLDLQEGLASFAAAQGINVDRLKPTVKALLYFFRASIRNNATPKQVGEDLIAMGLAQEKVLVIFRKWKAASALISRSTIQQTLMVNEVVDMQWRFGVTGANEELRSIGSAFLQLQLILDKGNTTETVNMELTLPQFYEFLSQMEKAKAQMSYFG